jgi:hypothetical protein
VRGTYVPLATPEGLRLYPGWRWGRGKVGMIGNLPTLDAAVQNLEAARTEAEVHRAGYKLLAVALLIGPVYDVRVPNVEEDDPR